MSVDGGLGVKVDWEAWIDSIKMRWSSGGLI